MSTRAAYGVRAGGKDYLTYNHSDGYPSSLGERLVGQVQGLRAEHSNEELKEMASQMQIVQNAISGGGYPSDEDIAALSDYVDFDNVGDLGDWYSVLGQHQGRLDQHLKSGYIVDAGGFILDSLFCEYAYVLNLDEEIFEAYRGFQSEPHSKGRFANGLADPDDYYPCALYGEFPADSIPESWAAIAYPEED